MRQRLYRPLRFLRLRAAAVLLQQFLDGAVCGFGDGQRREQLQFGVLSANSDRHCNPDLHRNSHADQYFNHHSHRTNRDAEHDANPDAHADGDSPADRNGDRDGDADQGPHGHADSDDYRDAHSGMLCGRSVHTRDRMRDFRRDTSRQ